MSDSRPTTPFPMPKMPSPADMAAMQGRSPLEQVMNLGAASGPIFQLPGQPQRTIVIWGFPYVDEVSDDRRFDKALSTGLQALRAFAGDGLFTAFTDEPNWGKAHRILLPAFSQQAMAAYHPEMLDLASQLALKWARLNPGDLVDVPADMTRLTLDTIGLCGFGYRFNSFYRTDLHPYVQGMVYTLDLATKLLTSGATAFPDDPELARYLAEMNDFVDELIAARKALGAAADDKRDLLQFMLTGVDKVTGERLDDETIRYEINTFLGAGHETTSGLLSFALYFLSKHPDIAARARDEVDRVFGDGTVLPTYEQVRALTYVGQVLKETLRLWPTAPGFARRPLVPDTLAGTWAIEPTDVIRVITPLLHRDPSVWGPDADVFNPDNFAPDVEKERPANAYKPFGTGQRACIGRQFALQEATLVLGMLLHRFEFIDAENYQLHIRQTLTIKPEGLRLALVPRPGRNEIGVGAAPATFVPSAPQPAAAPISADGHGAPLLVLFGSNLGSAEDLAYRIANGAAGRGFAPQVAPLDDRVGQLPTDGPLVIVTASYNGTPPDNARAFCDWLQSPDLAADALAGVNYAVFGCGNHEWTATYQAIPRLIDDGLAAHGAARIVPRGEGDAAGDFADQAADWIANLWEPLAVAAGLDPAQMTREQQPLYAVERVSAPANPFLSEAVQPLTILVNRELQRDSDRSTRHIEVVLPKGTTYGAGDHLGVIPRNGVDILTRALTRFGFAGDAFVRIRRNGAGTPLLPLDQPVAVVDLLSRYLDLQEVASRAQVETLAEAASDPIERAALQSFAKDPRYADEILAKRVAVLDLLERFPSVDLSFDRYLEMLHPLRVRYYSISSSPAMAPEACALTVAVVEGPARSGDGVNRGTASGYLARHPAASVIDGYVRSPNIAFRPPADPKTPIVMIGPGTGLAPFRGFLQERAVLAAGGETLGPAILFFGCRNPDHDYIYRDELEAYARNGIVALFTAFSRPDGGEKTYVQDLIRASGETVWSLIEAGGIVYVCGDGGKMEPAVRQAIADLATTYGGKSPDEARQWQADLAASGRYLADVWANG